MRKNCLQPARLVITLLFASPTLVAASGIVAGGPTMTIVATGPSGHQTVSIAPPVSGVSHNVYRQFDVSRAGADFNNAGVGARLIINEVQGSAPSLIEGPLAVLGPRASLVIANPNGITVNGGRFINTGNVAQTTGQVSFLDFPIAPEGLSGAMISLELIAADIRVHGPLVNENTGEGGRLRMVAGTSRAEINSAVSPTDNLTPWTKYTGGGARPGATAIDITPLGSLQAGRIEIIVTDQGAGVRHAGEAYASSGAFTLLSSGELKVDGGSIRAAGDLIVDSAALRVSAGERGASEWRSDGHMDLRAADISPADAALLGIGDISIGAPASGISMSRTQVDAGGGLTILGGVHSMALDASTLHAGGRLTAQASAAMLLSATDLLANGNIRISASAFSQQNQSLVYARGALHMEVQGDLVNAGGNFLNASPLASDPALVYGSEGDVLVAAGGELRNRHARIVANGRLDR